MIRAIKVRKKGTANIIRRTGNAVKRRLSFNRQIVIMGRKIRVVRDKVEGRI